MIRRPPRSTLFPTRRSSDLLVVEHRSGPKWDPSRTLEQQSGWPAHAAFMDELVKQGVIVLGGPLADEHHALLEDRKSTRLNSSHQIISYAGFCLTTNKHRDK